jgi:hypothetical protein
MIAQARAQARTAVQLAAIHPHWRTYLATGMNPLQRTWHHVRDGNRKVQSLRARVGDISTDRALSNRELRAARSLATVAYFEELEKTLRSQ